MPHKDDWELDERQLTRRKLLQRIGAGAVATLGAGAIHAFLWEPSNLEISRRKVPIRDLPDPFQGFRIAVLSDFHFGMSMTEEFAGRAVSEALKANPDMILVPGDFVHAGSFEHQQPLARVFAPLAAPHGVFGVLGNHDHWARENKVWKIIHDDTPIKLLMNESVLIEKDGHVIALAGTDDLRFGNYQPNRALGGLPPDVPRIFLQHQPDSAEELPRGWRVDLQISGHMHGGQAAIIRNIPGFVPSRYGTKFVEGLVQGASHRVFVTRGVGGHLPGRPRFFCRPEVSILELIPESSLS